MGRGVRRQASSVLTDVSACHDDGGGGGGSNGVHNGVRIESDRYGAVLYGALRSAYNWIGVMGLDGLPRE